MQEFCPDLLILDRGFNEPHLQHFVDQLLNDQHYRFIPTIITTTYLGNLYSVMWNLNVKSYLQKPYGIDRVLKVVSSLSY